MNRMNKQAGFSLVELMVVVAIIGVLASVAIPSFNKFQRRARAAEGKTMMSSHYEAQKAFLAEWEGYSPSLAAIGFTFEGATHSDFLSGNAAPAAGNTSPRYVTDAAIAFAATSAGAFNQLSAMCPNANFNPNCSLAASNPPLGFVAAGAAWGGALGPWTSQVATNVGSTVPEEWTMTDAKVMQQVGDGINAP